MKFIIYKKISQAVKHVNLSKKCITFNLKSCVNIGLKYDIIKQ